MNWIDCSKNWHDTSVDTCDVCGNLLINRYWQFADSNGNVLRACREDDAELLTWLEQQRTRPGYATFTSTRR